MTHPEEHLSGYVDGTLATDERAEVDDLELGVRFLRHAALQIGALGG